MPDSLVISVDAMGGDTAPDIVIDGIVHFYDVHAQGRDVQFLLHGNEKTVAPLLSKAGLTAPKVLLAHTDTTISMEDKPSHALRRGKGTSMWNTVAAVKSGHANVGVSAGNTGALMAMSKLQLRMKTGVQRPAIAALWPRAEGMCVVLDVGANIECDAAQLAEFAVMGDAYYRALFQTKNPRIGLLNVGTEDLKGNAVVKAAHERLSNSELGLNYTGYVEGNDISMGHSDVIVTDGFTGNIALKTAEGTAKLIETFMKETFAGSLWAKILAAPSVLSFKALKARIDPRRVNGGVFLGLNGIIIKSHGGTDSIGFANALNIAANLAETQFLEEIERTLTALHDEDDNIGFIA